MTDRIIDIGEAGAVLKVNTGRLVIESDSGVTLAIPLDEIGVLVGSHGNIRYTQTALVGISRAGGGVVLCDERHMPVAMVMPIVGHFAQTERIRRQMDASAPLLKRLWLQVVTAKVKAQGEMLRSVTGQDSGLNAMAWRVRPGDPDNIEAQAAKRYWRALFGEDFARDTLREDANRYLNYGYAVLRAKVARAIVACGLHPSVGIHHHNRYDGFCLASDLMEPFRPYIDAEAHRIYTEYGPSRALDREAKSILLGSLKKAVFVEKEHRELETAIELSAVSLAAVFEGKRKRLILPDTA